MKVVILQDDFPPYAGGGAGIIAAALARELAQQGHDLSVITCVQDKALIGSSEEDGIRIERIYSNYAPRWRSWLSLYNPATVGWVKAILNEVKPDVVHAHNVHFHLSYWSLHIARKTGAKVFLTAHDVMPFNYGKLTEPLPKNCESSRDYRISAWQQLRRYRFWYNPFRNFVIRRLLKNVMRIFAVSEALQDALVQNGIGNIEVIHNGINAAHWTVAPDTVQAFVHRFGLESKKVILFGGRISALKGGDFALSALREIVQKEPRAVLVLLGKQDVYTEKLMAQAQEWGIAEHIVAAGWLAGDSLKAAYHAASAVIVPSVCFDSFPTVILEAMACSKPVVSCCYGGASEIVVEGETGFLIPPYATTNLAEKIALLLGDVPIANRLGASGYARVVEKFSISEWSAHILRAYTVDYA